MNVTITIPPSHAMATSAPVFTKQVQDIVNALTPENLAFIHELSHRKGINQKLESKKGLIKTFT